MLNEIINHLWTDIPIWLQKTVMMVTVSQELNSHFTNCKVTNKTQVVF
jgi:alpha-D-ribose 1-methylphosphonate 5-triphosphate synthase subunit PhnH